MLTDTEAEHIPGCNMAFYKSALDQIGGFDPVFRKAGDDVDICWRLQQQGYKIGFRLPPVSSGITVVQPFAPISISKMDTEKRKHCFCANTRNILIVLTSRWAGRIYSTSRVRLDPGASNYLSRVVPGSALFQHLYTPSPSNIWMLCTSPEYHLLLSAPLLLLSLVLPWLWPLALASLLLSIGVCVMTAGQAEC